jgi:hypothetical protein
MREAKDLRNNQTKKEKAVMALISLQAWRMALTSINDDVKLDVEGHVGGNALTTDNKGTVCQCARVLSI